jgi:hypothetical protein
MAAARLAESDAAVPALIRIDAASKARRIGKSVSFLVKL